MFTSDPFKVKPDLGQLALNGDWEKAVSFLPGEFRKEEVATEYLGQASEVAFEAFFNRAFFGIRRIGTPETLSQFVVDAAEALFTCTTGKEFFELIARSRKLSLGEKFAMAEIGAVNAWRSVGSFHIADPVECLSSFDALWRQLQFSPVGRNVTHPKAIEFVFDNDDGATHWFAIPLSSDSPPFALERDKMRAALRSFQICIDDRARNGASS